MIELTGFAIFQNKGRKLDLSIDSSFLDGLPDTGEIRRSATTARWIVPAYRGALMVRSRESLGQTRSAIAP